MRNQSSELVEKRVAGNRGRKLPKEHKVAISNGLRGRKLSKEHRSKCKIPVLTGEAEKKRRKAISEQRKGTQGYGRGSRDRLDHFNALHWVVEYITGERYEFDNLQSWARAHEHLFLPDDRPKSKLPLWQRFVSGMNGIRQKHQYVWKGWRLISVKEIS